MTPDGRDYILNVKMMRAATAELFGFALYVLSYADDESDVLDGLHCGVVGTPEEAERWVAGDDNVEKMVVHT